MSSCLNNIHYNDLVYYIPYRNYTNKELIELLKKHPEIKFVSLIGVDLAGNDTDEKIPIQTFLDDPNNFLANGIQTDGSSVVLPGIATLNNGKVDMVADLDVNWFIDYNFENIDPITNKPIGTLRIPSILYHDSKKVDSRSILKNAIDNFKKEIKQLLIDNPNLTKQLEIDINEIKDIELTSATELEFWVKTPDDNADVEALFTSQVMQEQYWKRTIGLVRSAMEESLLILDKYGLKPEMGHKEVGGVKAQITAEGTFTHIMEQLEIDWKYSNPLQTSDNELWARTIIKDIFQKHGLELTFMAKPVENVAGSGEHTHVGVVLKMKNGSIKNLFAPKKSEYEKDFLNPIGWGALMGLLKNYEVINPIISCTNDSLNRLKPGFEAPICIVASIGHDVKTPSRNRTVLIGLIRDMDNSLSTRFEVRSPNPHTNTYLTITAFYQSMLDGIKAAIKSGKTAKELEKEFSKKAGEDSFYLEKNRAYRSEKDVFEHYTEEERNSLFGIPPATVWQNIKAFEKYKEKTLVLNAGNILEEKTIKAHCLAAELRWITELSNRIIPENANYIRKLRKLHDAEFASELDVKRWNQINSLRFYLMKDTDENISLFTKIRQTIDLKDFDSVSELQLEMAEKMNQLKKLYLMYKRNIIDFSIRE